MTSKNDKGCRFWDHQKEDMRMKITNDQEWEQYLKSVKVNREVFVIEATEAVMDKAEKGDAAACEWLEKRGLFKFPTTLNR